MSTKTLRISRTMRRPARTSPVLLAALILTSAARGQTTQPATSAPTHQSARRLFLAGDYDQTARICDALVESDDHDMAAAVLRAEVDCQTGDYAGGLDRLRRLRSAGDRSADWHAAAAMLSYEIGRYDDVERHNRRALDLDADHLWARRQLGRLYETLGRLDAAVETYRPFNERMTGGALPDSPEALTDLAIGFYRFTVLTRHPDLVRRTKHVLTDVLQEAFDYVDAAYWPARLAAAELLLEKHNLAGAKDDFEHVLKQNPRVADAAVGLGSAALEVWDFEGAERFAAQALESNPRHVGAHLLLGRTRMTERRFAEAAEAARAALQTNPNSIPALGLLAAAQLRAGDAAASKHTQEQARKISERPAAMHHALGVWLAAGRQFDEAERNLKLAVEQAPAWSEPRTELGLLYMETGEEARARETLNAAFALDSFNQRTYFVLELLDDLEKFARHESEHFILKFDADADAVIVPFFAETLESLHRDVCADFDFRPEKATIVEVFPRHDAFSVRVHGRPFIATVGACTGRVIALSAPRGDGPFGRFNWANVLRHEFTHTVTLAATGNRIPHWMTEGLAVHQEDAPRSWHVMQMLAHALRRGRLFTLKSIDWGFMRPRRADDRPLAYAQSEWMIEFIIARWGYRAVLDLLAEFREGRLQPTAMRNVLKMEEEEFDRAFASWAREQVAAWGLPTDPIEPPEALRERIEASPDDAGLRGRLALAELLDGHVEKAVAAARAALRRDRNETNALEVLCHAIIAQMLSEKEEAPRRALIKEVEPYVRRLLDVDPDNATGVKYLGYVEQTWEQWQEAMDLFSRYQRRYPDDPDTYRRLAGIHLLRGDEDAALAQLEQLFRLTGDEPAVARKIAESHAAQGDARKAARWWRALIEIDPYDADAHGAMGEALLKAGRHAEAERAFQAACRLLPDDPAGYDGLSRVYAAQGDEDRASEMRRKAQALGAKRSAPAEP